MKNIDILQRICDSMPSADDLDTTYGFGYGKAIKDLAFLMGLDEDDYGFKE